MSCWDNLISENAMTPSYLFISSHLLIYFVHLFIAFLLMYFMHFYLLHLCILNESASKHFDIVEHMFDHQSFLYDTYVEYKLVDPGTHRCEKHTNAVPPIDGRLFSAEQYFELIVNRCKVGYCQFYSTYFGQENILNRRVKFARD